MFCHSLSLSLSLSVCVQEDAFAFEEVAGGGTPYYLSSELCEGNPYNDKPSGWKPSGSSGSERRMVTGSLGD